MSIHLEAVGQASRHSPLQIRTTNEMNPCDPHEQQRRADYLESLYHLYGRNSPNVAHHGCYTGLLEQRIRDKADVLERNRRH
jgi:hypothetical protein